VLEVGADRVVRVRPLDVLVAVGDVVAVVEVVAVVAAVVVPAAVLPAAGLGMRLAVGLGEAAATDRAPAPAAGDTVDAGVLALPTAARPVCAAGLGAGPTVPDG
jgi:hypothetical protein